ncbi:MAG: hypothetical protein Q7R89_03625 [bacterium]|nr:hypothetical protein [bacterium]
MKESWLKRSQKWLVSTEDTLLFTILQLLVSIASLLAILFITDSSFRSAITQISISSLVNKVTLYNDAFHTNNGDFLSTIAASIVTIIAIAFSLALYSIQYAAEKGTSQILREYRNDPVYKNTFISLSIFSLLIFTFSLLPAMGMFTVCTYLLSFIFLIVTLLLLWRIFLHTIKLVNPLDRIQKLHDITVQYLRQLSENIDAGINSGAISISDDTQLDSQRKRDLLRTGVFNNAPNLLNPVRNLLSQIFDVIREYIPRRKYDVTAQGYSGVVSIVGNYFSARRQSLESLGLFGSQTDGFMSGIYEDLSALYRASLGVRDLQSAQQNLGAFQAIAIQAINYPSLMDRGNFPTVNMSTGYIKMNVVDGLKAEMDDLGLDGIRMLRNVEAQLPNTQELATNSIVIDIYDISFEALIRRKSFIVQEGTGSLVKIYHRWMKPYEGTDVLRKTIFEKLKDLSIYYLHAGLDISVNCQGLSAIFNIIDQESIPTKFVNSIPEITPENFDEDCVRELFHLYREVGEVAGEKQSFLLHFMFSGIYNIVINAVHHFGGKENKAEYEKILEEFIWLIAVHWYSYKKYPNEYRSDKHIEMTGIDNLVSITLLAIQNGFNKFAERMIGQITSVISTAIDKKGDEFTVPRLIPHLIKVGIAARAKGLDEIAAQVIVETMSAHRKFLEKNRPRVPAEYFSRYEERLSKEMWNIYTDFEENRRITAFDSNQIFRELVSLEQIMSYLNKIEKILYNREVTEPPHNHHGIF